MKHCDIYIGYDCNEMLRLALQVVAIAGYIVAGIYHATDIFSIPIPVVGLAWLIAVRFAPSFVDPAGLFWVTYALLIYQLISFHDLDACFLEKCSTTDIYSYISLGSTGLFWISMAEKSPEKYELKAEVKAEVKVEPPIEKEVFPALKIRINNRPKPSGPIKLKMGDTFQPRWV